MLGVQKLLMLCSINVSYRHLVDSSVILEHNSSLEVQKINRECNIKSNNKDCYYFDDNGDDNVI